MSTLVKSIEHLKELSKEDWTEFFITFNGGLRSSKRILYDSGVFEIVNEIDDSEQVLTEKELFTESNIGDAILQSAFYMYD